MDELDSLVDGVAVAYGTPESAAATRAASEGTAGVRDDGGLGGGGAGAASFAVGEQLQNMVSWSLGSLGVLGMGSEAAVLPQRLVQSVERLWRNCFAPARPCRASGAAREGRKTWSLKLLVSFSR